MHKARGYSTGAVLEQVLRLRGEARRDSTGAVLGQGLGSGQC